LASRGLEVVESSGETSSKILISNQGAVFRFRFRAKRSDNRRVIDRQQLRGWLETSLLFANGPAHSASALMSTSGLRGRRGLTLWKVWQEWLAEFQRPDPDRRRLRRLRRWCVANALNADGSPAVGVAPAGAPFTFDKRGTPQARFAPHSYQGFLALVGAELLAPDPAFGVVKCARKECPNLIVEVRVRTRGRPTKYCVAPETGTSHATTSSERQIEYKVNLAKKKRRAERAARKRRKS
jgi:hypothetical protein